MTTLPTSAALRATLRLQLHAQFTFDDAAAIVPYCAALGISHLYLSPIFEARPGSMHGYDVTDPGKVHPALGGEPALRRLVQALRAHGMGVIVDIVPNHMAASTDNAWWEDVLGRGRDSRFARFFDIDWSPADADLRDRVLLPVLGDTLDASIAAGALRLAAADGRLRLAIGDLDLPLSDAAQAAVLADFGPLPTEAADAFNRAAPHDAARWPGLLAAQHYVLAHWREAGARINWRRFFDINDLVALRAEDEAVFDATHALVLRLFGEGLIDGVRLDHVDGLADPAAYCERLHDALLQAGERRDADLGRAPVCLLVEKILAVDEALPRHWCVSGTTGYDFMEQVGALLHRGDGAAPLDACWRDAAAAGGIAPDYARLVEQARRALLDGPFAADAAAVLRALAATLPEVDAPALRDALHALVAHFPTYRDYPQSAPGRDALARALLAARRVPGVSAATLDAVAARLRTPGEAQRRFQQLTAPIAAKAIEDTVFYRYARLLSRNEVGAAPDRLSIDAETFHAACAARARDWPQSMLATATHDHKRGEDVRARLAVLSDDAHAWLAELDAFERGSAHLRRDDAPDRIDRLMLWQTLVGAWPLDLDADDADGRDAFAQRVVDWQRKALRESKRRTRWDAPDAAYESACETFVRSLLGDADCTARLHAGARRIAVAGAVNGLTQTLLRLTTPGVPDLYQGTEFWDLSLVDPDNRRAVDYTRRMDALATARGDAALFGGWQDGGVKQALVARVLRARRREAALFAEGGYLPVACEGARAAHVVAFLRHDAAGAALVIAPLHPLALLGDAQAPQIATTAWTDTRLLLPDAWQGRRWRSVLDAQSPSTEATAIAALLPVWPVGVYLAE